MKIFIEAIPHEGISWENKFLGFGFTQSQVEAVLGNPETPSADNLYYFDSELRLDFDESGKLEFIEFLGGFNGSVQPVIFGVNAFEAYADDLCELLKSKNNGAFEDENGYGYTFFNLDAGIWREFVPDDADSDEERESANRWQTLGIGAKGYY